MKQANKKSRLQQRSFKNRSRFVTGFLMLGAVILMAQAIYLQVVDQDFLNDQAAARQVRIASLAAHRGTITDRNGEPLAVSTPVDSVWAKPAELLGAPEHLPLLAKLLGIESGKLTTKLTRNRVKDFLYLKRHMNPSDAARIKAQKMPGVHLQREYRRYYPAAEVTGHLVGFANIDDVGQEALELAYDHRLAGRPGKNAFCRIP